MINSRRKSRFICTAVIGSAVLSIAGAFGADSSEIVRETFVQTAERWGLWAAFALIWTVAGLAGLVVLIRFIVGTMSAVIDDNTLSHLHLARVFGHVKCVSDSDQIVDLAKLEADQTQIGETGRRVLDRRKQREAKNTR